MRFHVSWVSSSQRFGQARPRATGRNDGRRGRPRPPRRLASPIGVKNTEKSCMPIARQRNRSQMRRYSAVQCLGGIGAAIGSPGLPYWARELGGGCGLDRDRRRGAVSVVEAEAPILAPAELFPDVTDAIIKEHRSWLAPRFYDPHQNLLVITMQSFLLKTRHTQFWSTPALAITRIACGRCSISVSGLGSPRSMQPAPARRISTSCYAPTCTLIMWAGKRDLMTVAGCPRLGTRSIYFRERIGSSGKAHRQAMTRTGDYFADSVLPIFEAGQAFWSTGTMKSRRVSGSSRRPGIRRVMSSFTSNRAGNTPF